jgi:hypothetical protein
MLPEFGIRAVAGVWNCFHNMRKKIPNIAKKKEYGYWQTS